jgi:hypothetical protein
LVKLWNNVAIKILPSMLALVTVCVVIPTIFDRIAFQAESYFGFVCENEMPPPTTLVHSRTFDFDPAQPCQRSGIYLEKNTSYIAEFEIISQEWSDKEIPANLAGLDLSQRSLLERIGFRVLAPIFRRVASEPWFEPILRVGSKGFQEIPARPTTPFSGSSNRRVMNVRFTTRAPGELFVFVNDAYPGIFPLAWMLGESASNPDGSLRHTYGNNSGHAKVTVSIAHDDPQ